MAVFKCKMCGGTLEIAGGESVLECEYCGTKQTLPKTTDEVAGNLFNRANNLRLKCEFDKAEEIYKTIVNENPDEAEGYWGMVLCRYGIEYVEDPSSHKRIPTCHRTSYEAVTKDVDYLAAIEHADALQKAVYEAEAKAIDEIQKDILSVVKTEKPFDVFICYKETDSEGKRTKDSAIANDIYYQLTNAGFKVFYAAITLEDKLGKEYEPYIFAALNSAKVMLVIGTRPEYFEAVWVKNEWSRFLKLMKNDRDKLLIPCFSDMDAYDLPEEFSHLQAQDMSKIGFINDVVRGIEKVVKKEEKTENVKTTVVEKASATGNVKALLDRGFMALEDGEWKKADEFFEQALNFDARLAEAYLGKLMAELEVRKRESLKDLDEPFDSNPNYNKAIRFGNEELQTELSGYIDFIKDRNEKARLEAERKAEVARIEAERKAEEARLEAERKAEEARLEAERKAEEARILAEKKKKQAIKVTKIATPIVCAVVAFMILLNPVILPAINYNNAVEKLESGNYAEAIAALAKAKGYKDSENLLRENYAKGHLADKLSASYFHTVGLKSDGTVVAVGSNGSGKCDVSSWSDIVAISAGSYHTVGLKSDGTVVAVGGSGSGQRKVSSWSDIVAVSAGGYHTVGLKSDGTVVAVGSNGSGQCDVESWSDIVAVYAGSFHTVGLKSDGTVVAVGSNDDGQCDVSSWSDIVAISAGDSHTVGLKSDGTVVAVGRNYYGQCDVSSWSDIVAVSAGSVHTVGLKSDGTLVAVGSNDDGQCDVSLWDLF